MSRMADFAVTSAVLRSGSADTLQSMRSDDASPNSSAVKVAAAVDEYILKNEGSRWIDPDQSPLATFVLESEAHKC